MDKDGKHICMLPAGPKCIYYSPAAGWWRHLPCQIRKLLLPCAWHYESRRFLRSNKSLNLERERQIKTARPWIVHPYSPVTFYWEFFTLFVNLVIFVYVPFLVFIPCSNPSNCLVLFSDAICGLGVIFNFLLACVETNMGNVNFRPRDIAKGYLRGHFVFDIIGALPLQTIQPFPDCNFPTHTLFYIFKLFRLPSMNKAWVSLYHQLCFSYLETVVLTLIGRITLFFHWATYIHFQVPALCAHFYRNNFEDIIHWLEDSKVIISADSSSTTMTMTIDKYVVNLYYATSLIIGACAQTKIYSRVIPKHLLTAGISLVGLAFMIYCFTCLVRLVMYVNYESFLFNGRVRELQEYLNFKHIPKSLQQKIQLFINYKFNGYYFNEQVIRNTVNEQMRQDINMFYCRKLVLNVPLFQDLPVPLINMLIFRMTRLLYMPGEIVVKYGYPASSLYLIASGTVACVNEEGKEVAHMKDGAHFGEQALLVPGLFRTATVVALEITDIYKLTNKEFGSCMQTCPRLKWRLEQRHREDDGDDSFVSRYRRPPAPLSVPPPFSTSTTSLEH